MHRGEPGFREIWYMNQGRNSPKCESQTKCFSFLISLSTKSFGPCFGNQNYKVSLFHLVLCYGVGIVGCHVPSWVSSQGEFGFLSPKSSTAFNFQLSPNSFTDSFFFFFENQSIKKNTSLNKSTLKHFKCTPLGSESPQRTFLAPSVPVWMVGIYSPEKFAHMGNFHPCVLRKRKQVSDLIETDGNTYRNGRMCVFMLPFYLN